jgi:hypothetical protein
LGRAGQVALVTLLLMAASAWGQLKNTVYSQPPAVVVEPLIVKESGFYPQKIVRPEGPFVLYIENRLPGHTGHFSLTLAQTNAAELVGLDTTAVAWRGATFLDLQPGNYQLRIPGSQGWSVAIQIQ